MADPAPCLKDLDVVILAGGLGTRIRDALGDTPKLLAPLGGTPFLDLLIHRLKSFGARRLVLGLGHLVDRVTAHLDAKRAVVVGRRESAVDFGGGENETASLGERDDLRHVDLIDVALHGHGRPPVLAGLEGSALVRG